MSSRGLIKSMLVIGSAQSVNILLSILRIKVLAILLGPAGVGLLGIFNSLQQTASMLAGLGLGTSGVRQIAFAKGDEKELSRIRTVLVGANFVQGCMAMAAVWFMRERLALWLLGDVIRAEQIGLIGVGVLLSLLTSSQIALLQGMRLIGDLARVTVFGGIGGTIAGLLVVWLQGLEGLIWFVLVQPLAAVLVALYFTQKLPKLTVANLTPKEMWAVWQPMAALGGVFMLGGLATTATLLLVRGIITQELGLAGAGLFAASWGVTMTYVGFLLGAMAADYYPRLTEVIDDHPSATRLMNDQTQLGLAIGGPVLLLLIGLAPWVITLLYSSEFTPAAEMVQWQTVGNVFKLASWPLGFAFVAAARSRVFLFTELLWNLLFFIMIWVGLPLVGLEIAGTAFLIAYVIYFIVLNALVRQLQGFRWEPLSLWLIGTHAGLAFAVLALAKAAPVSGAMMSVLLALVTGIVGLRIILIKVGTKGRLANRLTRIYALIRWPLEKNGD